MDTRLFLEMISDENKFDLNKMKYKYSPEAVEEMLNIVKDAMMVSLPISDFSDHPVYIMDNYKLHGDKSIRAFFDDSGASPVASRAAVEEEITSSLCIEEGDAGKDDKSYANMRAAIDFINDLDNKITEVNLYRLCEIVTGEKPKSTARMANIIAYANTDDDTEPLIKAAVIHFHMTHIHPYFDGSGRIARLLHMWYLMQQGYKNATFVALSKYIASSRREYDEAFKLVEENAKISGFVDLSPFIEYFIENVYDKMECAKAENKQDEAFRRLLAQGAITEKEANLWQFVIAQYGDKPFSTKQLERDYGGAAYATIRSFVMKMEKQGLLTKTNYSNRPKYALTGN